MSGRTCKSCIHYEGCMERSRLYPCVEYVQGRILPGEGMDRKHRKTKEDKT